VRHCRHFLYLVYICPGKLYPVFIPVFLSCEARAGAAAIAAARRLLEKNVDALYFIVFAAMTAALAALLQFCDALLPRDRP